MAPKGNTLYIKDVEHASERVLNGAPFEVLGKQL
jgi:hypothetical protein